VSCAPPPATRSLPHSLSSLSPPPARRNSRSASPPLPPSTGAPPCLPPPTLRLHGGKVAVVVRGRLDLVEGCQIQEDGSWIRRILARFGGGRRGREACRAWARQRGREAAPPGVGQRGREAAPLGVRRPSSSTLAGVRPSSRRRWPAPRHHTSRCGGRRADPSVASSWRPDLAAAGSVDLAAAATSTMAARSRSSRAHIQARCGVFFLFIFIN